jgi:Uma2 family endonuclease
VSFEQAGSCNASGLFLASCAGKKYILVLFNSPEGRLTMETVLEFDEEISDYERERGKPMPSIEHSKTEFRLLVQLANFPHVEPYPELNLNLEGYKSVPDIAVFGKDHLKDNQGEIWATVPPLLTIEILSPGQSLKSLFDKAAQYLAHGVEEAWVVIPESQSITVCKPGGYQKTFTEGIVIHTSTGITINISQIFQ